MAFVFSEPRASLPLAQVSSNGIAVATAGSVRVIPQPMNEDRFTAEHVLRSCSPVDLDLQTLKSKFGLRLADAARTFNISITSLKKVCRKLGIARWPRRRRPRTTRGSPPNNRQSENDGPPLVGSFQSTSGLSLATATQKRFDDMLQSTVRLQNGIGGKRPLYLGPSSLPLVAHQNVNNANTPQCLALQLDTLPRLFHSIPKTSAAKTEAAANISLTSAVSAAATDMIQVTANMYSDWLQTAVQQHSTIGIQHALPRPFHANIDTPISKFPGHTEATPWTSAVSSATADVVTMSAELRQIMLQMTMQQKSTNIHVIPLGHQPSSTTGNMTVSAKILATQRELASLRALQALQNDTALITAYPPLHLLLQQ